MYQSAFRSFGYGPKEMLEDCMRIMLVFQGQRLEDLKEMPWDLFQHWLTRCDELRKESENGNG